MDGDPVIDVMVPYDANNTDNAVLLLAAAEDLGLDQGVVRTTDMGFVVPEEVHEKAFPPAKKAAKKTTARKAQE